MYDRREEKQTFENPDNAWLKTLRLTQTADGRSFAYCSDICEIKGVESGKHNIPTPQVIAPATGAAAVLAAAKEAAARKATDEAIRAGGPAKVQITDGK
jgi:hypothetical protein